MSTAFSNRLLAWYDREGRKDLPWQRNRTPYRVWLSEVMLQQTQVRTVIPYFERFVTRFPTVQVLADAPLDEVFRLWAGLGYYTRARNLHLAAQQLCERFAGELPACHELLMELPGVGRSTAGAVLALCFDQAFPILDGNVKRVLTRHGDIGGWPGKAEVERRLWRFSAQLLPSSRIGDYTQGIMDLGATLCTRTKPRCHVCPVSSDCEAKIKGRIAQRPTPAPKRNKPLRSVAMLLVTHGDEVLLHRRLPGGIWGGLLCPPQIDQVDEAQEWCRRRFGVFGKTSRWHTFRHEFTHFSLNIYPVGISLRNLPRRVMESDGKFVWYKIGGASRAGVPAPVRKLLVKLDSLSTSEK